MIIEVQADDRERWNSLVKSFQEYDVFYLNEYVMAFAAEEENNGIPLLLYYESSGDRAINVVFIRDISRDEKFCGKVPEGTYYDLITPYGYGGFWGKVSDYDNLNQSYNAYCVSKNYICEFVRFNLFGEYRNYYDGHTVSKMHNVVRGLEIPLDDMWMNFKPKVRKNVKKAQRSGLEVISENTGKHLGEFLQLYYATMDRSNAKKEYYFSKDFFMRINCMRDHVQYFHVLYKGELISSELVIYGTENCYSYLGGTNGEYFDLRPNDLLKYEVIRWAKQKGLKNFVLGGGYGADDGIFLYKSCLAPDGIVDFYVGEKIFDRKGYDHLVELRKEISLKGQPGEYFPEYRR